MTDQYEPLTYEQAVAMLPAGDTIHTLIEGGAVLLGASWDRDAVLDLIACGQPEVAGPGAAATGHGLAVCRPDGAPVFIRTRDGDGD